MSIINGLYEIWTVNRSSVWDFYKRILVVKEKLYALERDETNTRKILLYCSENGIDWSVISQFVSTVGIGPIFDLNLLYDEQNNILRIIYDINNAYIVYNDYDLVQDSWGEEVYVNEGCRQLFATLGKDKVHVAYEAYIFIGSWNWRFSYRNLDISSRAWGNRISDTIVLYTYQHPTIALLDDGNSELPIVAYDSLIYRINLTNNSLVNEYSGSGNNFPRLNSSPGLVHITMPYNDSQIYYRYRTSYGWQGSWQLIFDRSNHGLAAVRTSELVCDENGVLHCLVHGASTNTNDIDRIYYLYRNLNGQWSTPILIWNGDDWKSGETWQASSDGRDTGAISYRGKAGVAFTIPVYRVDNPGSEIMLLYAINLEYGYPPPPKLNTSNPISPNEGIRNNHLNVIILGENFENVVNIKLKKEEEETEAYNLSISPSAIECEFYLPNQPGYYDLIITDVYNQSDSITGAFLIKAEPPTITEIEPTEGFNNNIYEIDIKGTNFLEIERISLIDEEIIVADSFEIIDENNIKAIFNLNGAFPAVYDLKIEGTYGEALAEDIFEIFGFGEAKINSIIPNSGGINKLLTIKGYGFGENIGNSRVIFVNNNKIYIATVYTWADKQIQIFSPEIENLDEYEVIVQVVE